MPNDLHFLPDTALVDDMRFHDDQKAFEELYRRYSDLVFSVAATKVRHREDAEEIVQITFVKLWQSRKTLSIHSSLKAYLYTSIRNNVISFYSSQFSKTTVSLDTIHPDTGHGENFTQHAVDVSQLKTFYEKSLDELPQKCRDVFVMSRSGYSMNEIAKAQNISPKTVEVHIGKALRILRQKFRKGLNIFTTLF